MSGRSRPQRRRCASICSAVTEFRAPESNMLAGSPGITLNRMKLRIATIRSVMTALQLQNHSSSEWP